MKLTLKVRPNSCKLHKEFARRNFTQRCYAAYAINVEDRELFGNNSLKNLTSNAYVLELFNKFIFKNFTYRWHYTAMEWTKTAAYAGVVSKYGGGGYVQLFTRKYLII